VKSKVFNLSDFVGIVDATGIVEKMYQGMPIIDIVAISGTTVGEHAGDIDIVLDEPSGLYLLSAGVYFLPTFFQEYLLLNEGEN